MLSFIGTQVTVVAVPIQVYRLTGSSFAVGMVGLAGVVPLLVCSLLGGTLADAMDRRRLLLITQTLMGLTSVGLALNASVASPHLWALYVLPAITAGLSGIDVPTYLPRSAPGLAGADQLTSANALMQIVMQVGQVLGPALSPACSSPRWTWPRRSGSTSRRSARRSWRCSSCIRCRRSAGRRRRGSSRSPKACGT